MTHQWMSTEKPEADFESVSELCKPPVEDKTRLLDYGILHQEKQQSQLLKNAKLSKGSLSI